MALGNSEKKYRWAVVGFFVLFFVLGLWIYDDYGVSWDEFIQRISGYISYRYIAGADDRLLTFPLTKYYGPVFEIVLVSVEQLFRMDDMGKIYLMRHFLTFLLFYLSVIFFYLLCKRSFQSWKIGLVGALFLILSPRIFADAFYNSKDLPFMSMFIISIYTLVRFLDMRSKTTAFAHALACALLTDIRVMGVLVPAMTVFYYVTDVFVQKHSRAKRVEHLALLGIYLLLASGFTVLFWPILWNGPLHHLVSAFIEMSHYPSKGEVLYFGNWVRSQDLPWHYVPGWILATTPVLYSVLFLIGVVHVKASFFRGPKLYFSDHKPGLIALMWFFVPVLAVIFLKSVLYDAWRQVYFIYPGFLLLSLYGLVALGRLFENRKIAVRVLWIIVAASLLWTAVRMVRMHPFQNVYFSMLAGKNIEERFERDYWGLSYRRALEYILEHDTSPAIKVFVLNSPGHSNVSLLKDDAAERLVFVKHPRDAKYFLTNFKGQKGQYPFSRSEYYSVKVDGFKILGVYRFF